MSEDEAKTKTCHRTLAPTHDSLGGVIYGPAACIGSACMAWRVSTVQSYQENAYNQPEPPEGDGWKPASPTKGNVAWWRTIPERTVGYCGLVGRPS